MVVVATVRPGYWTTLRNQFRAIPVPNCLCKQRFGRTYLKEHSV